jgi:hypothetical protein
MVVDSQTTQGLGAARPFLSWLLSAVTGSVLALVLTSWFSPAFFGVVYRDPASVWIFAGIMDVLVGCMLLKEIAAPSATVGNKGSN